MSMYSEGSIIVQYVNNRRIRIHTTEWDLCSLTLYEGLRHDKGGNHGAAEDYWKYWCEQGC